ncbi:MAG: 2-dehydropantoate 2-reductase [Magnetococcales bacterium]|nr:2-dehydropantoate 2-reductase [Magnetococcales bacterium]
MVPPRILVVGTGAVGGFYGARLAAAGARVAAVCRSDLETVRRQGIAIESFEGDRHFTPEPVLARAEDYDGPADYILVTLKVLPEIDLPVLIAPAVGPQTVIVLIQNGVEIEAPVVAAFPNQELLSGLAFVCLNRIAPGRIRHTCAGRLMLGRYPEGPSPAAERLAALFRTDGLTCGVSPTIVRERWRKLVWNAPFNPVSVLGGGATTRQMLSDAEGVALARGVMEEVLAVAAAVGHPLPEDLVERNLRETLAMTPYKTSMLVDFQEHRVMEVEAILGNAVRAARRTAVPAPRLETLYALLRLLTRPDAVNSATTRSAPPPEPGR